MIASQHFVDGTYVVVQQKRALVEWNMGNGTLVVSYEDGEIDILRPLGLRHLRSPIEVGSRVRIMDDEYPELVGTEWEVYEFSRDYTCVWLTKDIKDPFFGVWCAVAHLEALTDAAST